MVGRVHVFTPPNSQKVKPTRLFSSSEFIDVHSVMGRGLSALFNLSMGVMVAEASRGNTFFSLSLSESTKKKSTFAVVCARSASESPILNSVKTDKTLVSMINKKNELRSERILEAFATNFVVKKLSPNQATPLS